MSDANDVQAYESNCGLKKEVGADFSLAASITPEQIKACGELLDTALADFFNEAASDLAALKVMVAKETASLPAMLTHTYNIKSLAKVLGLTLVTDLCIHMVDTVYSGKLKETQKRALLAKLVEALDLTFARQIRDDGGRFGSDLRARLHRSL